MANRTRTNLAKKYQEIFKKYPPTTSPIEKEWRRPGDLFEKLSRYERYTPVKTSGSTELTKEI